MLLNVNSYCTLFMIKSQSSPLESHYLHQRKPRWKCNVRKRWVREIWVSGMSVTLNAWELAIPQYEQHLVLSGLATMVNKVSFESSKAGLLMTNNATTAEVCNMLCTKTSGKIRHCHIWTSIWVKEISWLVHVAERIRGKLTTFNIVY